MADFVNIVSPEYMEVFRKRQSGPVDAVPTPLASWNKVCGGDGGGEGLARRWLVTIGGNAKQGKTLLSLNMCATALRAGERVGMMSLEMSDPELAARFYSMIGKVPVSKMQKGGHWDAGVLDTVAEQMMELPYENGRPSMFVNDEPIFALHYLLEHMQFLRDQHRVRWFIIDYLQLVSMGDDSEAVNTITVATKELRRFAKLNDSVVIMLSQFKRTMSEDRTQSPVMQGLFGGGAIEQCSDQIILLDHSLHDYDQDAKTSRTWLRLTNRHGQHGAIPIEWNYRDLTLREADPDEERDWPTHDKGKKAKRR